jgi:hypothetical protein
MRRAISDPTAGERARRTGAYEGQSVRRVDPTDPQYGTRGETGRSSDPMDPRDGGCPVGHVVGRRRGDALPASDPGAPVLRLSGFRPHRRGK